MIYIFQIKLFFKYFANLLTKIFIFVCFSPVVYLLLNFKVIVNMNEKVEYLPSTNATVMHKGSNDESYTRVTSLTMYDNHMVRVRVQPRVHGFTYVTQSF